MDPDTGDHIVFSNTVPDSDFSRTSAVMAGAPDFGSGGLQYTSRSKGILLTANTGFVLDGSLMSSGASDSLSPVVISAKNPSLINLNGQGTPIVRQVLPDGSMTNIYANGIAPVDPNTGEIGTLVGRDMSYLGGVLSNAEFTAVSDRASELYWGTDSSPLYHRVAGVFDSVLGFEANPMRTSNEQMELEGLQGIVRARVDLSVHPERYNSDLHQLVVLQDGGTLAGAGYLAAAGGGREARLAASTTGQAAGGIAMAFGSGYVAGGDLAALRYQGVQGTINPEKISPKIVIPRVAKNAGEHEEIVSDYLRNEYGRRDVGSQVHLNVALPNGEAVKIIPDELIRVRSGGKLSYEINDSKFGYDNRDLVSGGISVTSSQAAAFSAIRDGTALVTIANSMAGRRFFASDFSSGTSINVNPNINLYISTPAGIAIKPFPRAMPE